MGSQENFAGEQQPTATDRVVAVVALVVVYALLLLLGKYLWNTCLVPAVSVVNPVKNVWHILGLSVLARLMFGN